MANRTPNEQAVIQALQAVANYPESRDFVEFMSRSLPGLQTLLDASLQPEGCKSTWVLGLLQRPNARYPLYPRYRLSQTRTLDARESRPMSCLERRVRNIALPAALPMTSGTMSYGQW